MNNDDRTGEFVPTPEPTTPAVDVAGTLPEALIPAGERYGNFVLTGEAGRDGPFTLWNAWQIKLARTVVLKRPTAGAPAAVCDWLRAEAAVAVHVTHPGVVSVAEAGEVDGAPYLAAVMSGESLAARLARGSVPERIALNWIAQLVETLCELHRNGIIHGNIRPEYVHAGIDGRVRLSGFGTSSWVRTEDEFTPPERENGKAANVHSDVYGAGAVLNAMLTTGTRSRWSADLGTILERCLTGAKDFRYGGRQPAVLFLMDLRRYAANRPLRYDNARTFDKAWRWTRRNKRAVAWAIFALAIVLGGRWWDRRQTDAAWEVLTRPDAAPAEYARAAAHFDRLHDLQPQHREFLVGVVAADFRLGRTVVRPSFYAQDAEDARWGLVQRQVEALGLLQAGRFKQAEDVAGHLSTDYMGAPIATRWSHRLEAEYDARLDPTTRAIVRQISFTDAEMAAMTRGVPLTDVPMIAMRQLVLNACSWNDSVGEMDAKHPGWQRHAGTRRAIPELVARTVTWNSPRPAALLEAIDPNWPELPEAREAIAPLLVAWGPNFPSKTDSDRGYEAALRRIDPNWVTSAEARAAIPTLVLKLGDRDSPGDPRLPSPIFALLSLLDSDWPRSPEAHRAIEPLIERLTGTMSQDGNTNEWGTLTLLLLAWLDPEWRQSDAARKAVRNVLQKLAEYEPGMVRWYNREQDEIRVPESVAPSTKPIRRAVKYEEAQRALGLLCALGPVSGDVPELLPLLDHPNEVYDSHLLAIAGVSMPAWFATPPGKIALERLVTRCGSEDRPTREAAQRALAYIPTAGTDIPARAIAAGLEAHRRRPPRNTPLTNEALKQLEPTWPDCDIPALAARWMADLSHADAAKQRLAMNALGSLGPLAGPATATLLADRRLTDPDLRGPVYRGEVEWIFPLALGTASRVAPGWEGTTAARQRVPELLAYLSAEIPEGYRSGNEDTARRILRDTVDRIDPAWRYRVDAGKHLPALAHLLRLPEPLAVRRQGVPFRCFEARVTLVWYARTRFGGSGRVLHSPVHTACVRILADPLNEPIDRKADFETGSAYSTAKNNLLHAIVEIGPTPEIVPHLIGTLARADYSDADLVKMLDGLDPNWPGRPEVSDLLPVWDARLRDDKRERYRLWQELQRLGPAAAPLSASLVELLNTEQSWPAALTLAAVGGPDARKAIPILLPRTVDEKAASDVSQSAAEALTKLDPDWAWSPTVDAGLRRLREIGGQSDLNFITKEKIRLIIERIDAARKARPK